ncbi:3-deoxy-D-manno-octulosonic acid transferase [Neolewinella antarctica]|uniref:3-deoxy-D-manno-octulosonic acid transferase n=1 Tax=Neolewinella antarctica TaxID=442734 RepID=A0ABX0XHI4_9BACT|nr:glycosyltransferase N-terminal domain-containing protein [Neolewinella antarctica]NJC28289.1 3-deoxy-D-manno-octulosonic-acid transferase [Neolewinella antarctica]
MTALYRFATEAYHTGIAVAGRFGNERARKWTTGRDGQETPPKPTGKKRLWMHCASLGEWEQGRPVLEDLRKNLPEWEVVLTFFSPSGYDRAGQTELAEHVLYLPPDSPENATAWVRDLAPDLAIFVKYEFWYFHLQALHAAGVPTWLVAATFRPEQLFFKFYGSWYREMLQLFTGIITQTKRSKKLLVESTDYPGKRIWVAGDPRMDRTLALTQVPWADETLTQFCAGKPTIFAGSVWPHDLDVWKTAWPQIEEDWQVVFAPHQLQEEEINQMLDDFDGVRYTEVDDVDLTKENVLILDTIGMLSKAYRYGRVAYVGGAFRTGLHSTLEPMAYGLPTIFGPKHKKFPEAQTAVDAGGAFVVTDDEDLIDTLHHLNDNVTWEEAHRAQLEVGQANAGAGSRTADIILQVLAARKRVR